MDSFEIIWTYKVNGEEKDFAQSEEPWNIEGAEYVDRKEKLVRKGYVPPIHDFSISDFQQNEYTEDFLVATHSLFIITHKTEKARTGSFPELNLLASWAMENNIKVAGLSASTPLDTRAYAAVRNNPYDSYTTDATTLKTMIRSNPGIILLKEGTVMGKWPSTDLPSVEEIKALL